MATCPRLEGGHRAECPAYTISPKHRAHTPRPSSNLAPRANEPTGTYCTAPNQAQASSLVTGVHGNLSEARGWLSSRVLSVYDFTKTSRAHSQAPSSNLAPQANEPTGTYCTTTNQAQASSLVTGVHGNLSEARGWLSSRVLSVYGFTKTSRAHSQAPSSKLAPRVNEPTGTYSTTTNQAQARSLVTSVHGNLSEARGWLSSGVLSLFDFTKTSRAHSQAPSSNLAPRANEPTGAYSATSNHPIASSLVTGNHWNLSEARECLSSRVLSVNDFTKTTFAHSQAPSSKLTPR